MEKGVDVKSLCQLHTNLKPEEIDKICEVSRNLSLMADLSKSNIFIDCLAKDGRHAIVVAESFPDTGQSIYNHSVVGKVAYECFEPAVFFTLRKGKPMFLNRAVTQEGKIVEQSVIPINNSSDMVIGALVKEKEIHQSKHSENDSPLSNTAHPPDEYLFSLTGNKSIIPDVLGEALFILKPGGKVLYFNPSAKTLVSELCNSSCCIDVNFVKYFPMLRSLLSSSIDVLQQEITIFKRTFEVKKVNLKSENKLEGIFVSFRDLTELREVERELMSKSVAIHEIHHRVKNNLQTVASLLHLQIRRDIPQDSKSYLQQSLNRVLSISSVYELILASSNMDEVDIYRLIEKIGDTIVKSVESDNINLTISYKGSQLFIESKKAVSVALVINELIQNCIKHAFTGVSEGEIEVCFTSNGYIVEIQVKDNGIGILPSAKYSLGLSIVNMMIKSDLSGNFDIKKVARGTVALIRFPLEGGIE